MSYWQTMFCTVASVEVTGRGLWWVTDGIEGRTGKGILFIPSAWIVEIDPLQTWWKIRPTYSTQDFTIPGDEVVNFHYPSPEGNSPNEVISPLSKVSEAVLTDLQIQTAQHSAFKNGIFPKVILTAGRLPSGVAGVPGERPTFTPQQRIDLLAAIQGAYRGVINSDEPIILDSLIEKIERFSQTIMEMDFMGSSKITKARVMQGWGVSAHSSGRDRVGQSRVEYRRRRTVLSTMSQPIARNAERHADATSRADVRQPARAACVLDRTGSTARR